MVTVGRWHLFIGIGGGDAFDELALVGFAGKDGGVAGFEGFGGELAGVEAKAAFVLAGTVAAVTVFGEDRADVAGEIEGLGGCGRGGERPGQSGEREEDGDEGADQIQGTPMRWSTNICAERTQLTPISGHFQRNRTHLGHILGRLFRDSGRSFRCSGQKVR